VNYPSVLERLSRIPRDALRDLLLKAWHFTAFRHKSRARRRPKNAAKRKRALQNST